MPANPILIRKELRQNALLYVSSACFLLVISLIKYLHSHLLSTGWVEILGVALPVALAGAYGLQAFDSEENSQTRDFLLTKPLGVKQIVWSKYLPGLFMLLIFTFLWQSILLPQSIQFPDLFNLQSLWFSAFILITTTIYSMAFATGLLVKGPKKLVIGLFSGFLLAGWFFIGWCATATALYLVKVSFKYELIVMLFFFSLTIGLIIIASLTSLSLSTWFLSRSPFQLYKKNLSKYLGLLLLFPLCSLLAAGLQKPVIRPFNSLAASFFKLEPWFVAVKGFKRPGQPGYAFIDHTGRIALAQGSAAKPEVIISPPTPARTNRITWSGDGRNFTFDQNGVIQTYELATAKTTPILPGELGFWSENNDQILISQIIKRQTLEANGFKIPAHTIKFSLFDRKQNAVTYWVRFNSMIASSLEWDSSRGQLLALDRSWSLKLIHLNEKRVQTIDFLSSLQAYEIITRSQIIHSRIKPSAYDLIVFSVDKANFIRRRNRFNLRWYTYEPDNLRIKLKTTIMNIPNDQLDWIWDANQKQLLSNNGSGVYQAARSGGR